MSSDKGRERSERLRRRRQESAEKAQSDEETKPSEPSKTDESDEPDELSVKDEQVGTYMYLPQSQKKELDRLYNMLKAEYEFEFETEFEKNRHFFPLVVKYGLDGLDGLDATEIQDRLQSL